MLQSAVLQIENIENSNYCADCAVHFNTPRSQRSFVTENVSKNLKLSTIRIEKMISQFFGQNNNKAKEVDIVQIKIKGKNEHCIFTENICSHIKNKKYHFAKNNYDHLRNINLLNHSEGDSIDLLVGNDLYYLFINGNIVKSSKNQPIGCRNLSWRCYFIRCFY